jgi:D-inositol-3-phosphate glycosyltransferase
MLIVDTVVQFFPRGGSAQVVRYLAREFTGRDMMLRVICGSLGVGGMSDAMTFYSGLDVSPMDYSPAAAAYTGGYTGMDCQPDPFHPSYEDRGPAAPDRLFTAVPPRTIDHLTDAWTRHLSAHRNAQPDLVHLHHLSHLQEAVRRAYPDTPVITTLHGTDLKLLDRAQRVSRFARRIGVPLTALRDAHDPSDPDGTRTALDRIATAADLTETEATRLHQTDWQLWPYADLWSAQMGRLVRCAGRIVVVSDSDAAHITRLLGVPPTALTVVPNGVDTTRFTARRLTDSQRMESLRHWLIEDPQGWAPHQPPGR